MSNHINWFCEQCPKGECEVRHAFQKQEHEERCCPENIKALWYRPGEQVTEAQFRKWFWDAMCDFVELAYYPPGLDKLKDATTWAGFYAMLNDDDCEAEFLKKC